MWFKFPGFSFYSDLFKRIFDIFFSFFGLLVLSPLFLIIFVLITLDSRGPIIFKQIRVGHKGKQFKLYKFRTMDVATDPFGPSPKSGDDPRLTKIGRFLREYSLDELPQLFNVLKGNMSIVGPRPERSFFIKKLRNNIDNYDKRLVVRPGLTGLAQVEHKYDESEEDTKVKVKYDLDYVNSINIFKDIKIILKTVYVVLAAKGM